MKRQQKDIEASKKAQDQALGLRVLMVKQRTARSDEAIRLQIEEDLGHYREEMSEADKELTEIDRSLGDVGNLATALQGLLQSVGGAAD